MWSRSGGLIFEGKAAKQADTPYPFESGLHLGFSERIRSNYGRMRSGRTELPRSQPERRVRNLREVVARQKLTVEEMVRAGLSTAAAGAMGIVSIDINKEARFSAWSDDDFSFIDIALHS